MKIFVECLKTFVKHMNSLIEYVDNFVEQKKIFLKQKTNHILKTVLTFQRSSRYGWFFVEQKKI